MKPEAQGTPGGALRLFYWAQPLGRWVEIPASTDTGAHTVTSHNVDVSAFVNQLTPFALMG